MSSTFDEILEFLFLWTQPVLVAIIIRLIKITTTKILLLEETATTTTTSKLIVKTILKLQLTIKISPNVIQILQEQRDLCKRVSIDLSDRFFQKVFFLLYFTHSHTKFRWHCGQDIKIWNRIISEKNCATDSQRYFV